MSNFKILLLGFCATPLLLAGCTDQQCRPESCKPLCVEKVTIAEAIGAAEDVLGKMHFSIEKSDPNTGIIRTRPLSGAQFFEFWRYDNIGSFNSAESNLQNIRRIVELNFNEQDGRLCIKCTVQTQRLSLPERQVTSSAQAYRMYSLSTTSTQTLKLSPQQKKEMAWIDLGNDEKLAGVILEQIKQKIVVRSS
jgi:hypothetical protein